MKASKAASIGRVLILVSGYGGSGLDRAAGAWAFKNLVYNDLSLGGCLEFVNDRIGGLVKCRTRGDEKLYNGDAERSDRSLGSRDSLHDECFWTADSAIAPTCGGNLNTIVKEITM